MRNLIGAGHSLKVYDLSKTLILQCRQELYKICKRASSEVDFVVTMVPVGSISERWLEDGVLAAAAPAP